MHVHEGDERIRYVSFTSGVLFYLPKETVKDVKSTYCKSFLTHLKRIVSLY